MVRHTTKSSSNTYVAQIGAMANVLVQLALLALVLDQRSRMADV